MPLNRAVASDTATLLAWTDPRPYEAGFMGKTAFPAGMSMRVCLGTDDHGFVVLKVKTADIENVVSGLEGATRGIQVEVTYTEGRDGQAGQLKSLKRVGPATPVAKVS